MIRLRHYTNLAATIHLLREQNITLRDPEFWDDRNDAYFMAEYKRRMNVKTVLAICFAEAQETYHHWKVFAGGSDGVCLVFDKAKLLTTFDGDKNVVDGPIKYMDLNEVKALKHVADDRLPFLKRAPYEDEREHRVVYRDANQVLKQITYPIKLNWIDRIVLGPWMNRTLAQSVSKALKSIDKCSAIKITKTTLVDNETWKALATSVTPARKPGAA
jgi:hypothetical protein